MCVCLSFVFSLAVRLKLVECRGGRADATLAQVLFEPINSAVVSVVLLLYRCSLLTVKSEVFVREDRPPQLEVSIPCGEFH